MHGPRSLQRATWLSLHLVHSMDAVLHTDRHAEVLARHLSRIKGVSPRPNPNGVIFFACDAHFMERFGWALICSCYENARECGVHVHLYEPTPRIMTDLDAMRAQLGDMHLTYTYEDGIDFGALPDRG